ncbi:aminotransferase [Mesobacillus zeae]|uniref:Aminotransferase n=1 Tax=Mesobacillus zeae TaxID=1917180 RepID=A0A398AY42_9BACI|nr:aminotransferase [Mesobacillus zeae]RID82485.1 aminotransferase [Mesobacillus zeae]
MKIANFGVEEWLNVWENDAIYDIAGSSIASFTLEEIISIDGTTPTEFFDGLLHKKMNYGWIEGSPEFKTEVSKLYKNVPADNILQTNGATGANLLALYALIEPNDHVIAMHPSYQQLYDIPRSYGAEVDLWEIDEDHDWLPDLEELKKLIRPNTKMICLNNANNPTGTILEDDYMKEVIKIAEKVGAYILVDEVYKPLDPSVRVTSIVDLYDRGISTNSLSKTYSVPGIRVGWTATNKELADLFRKYRDYTMICAGVFDDYLAVHILKNKEKVMERNAEIVHTNLEILKEWVEKEPRVSLICPKHVSTSFIKLDIPVEIEQFCIDILKNKGVLLVPGNRFDVPGHARLGYCTHTEVLKNGLRELSEYLKQFDK